MLFFEFDGWIVGRITTDRLRGWRIPGAKSKLSEEFGWVNLIFILSESPP